MSKYGPVVQAVSAIDDDQGATGSKGTSLFRLRGVFRWYLGIIVLYTGLFVGMAVWTISGPRISAARRVLPTRNLKVDQFYSGLVLSAVLAPAGILVRRLANDFGLLHPIAIAAKTPVLMADLDRMMDPGVVAAKTAFSYSRWHSLVQALLLAVGALLVPIGTLLITTGEFAPMGYDVGLVGQPTMSGAMTMNIEQFKNLSVAESDLFLSAVMDMFKGSLTARSGSIADTGDILGPISTPNITFETGVRYHGLVSYTWSSGCTVAEDISYVAKEQPGEWWVNVTFPDGSWNSGNVWEPDAWMWADQQTRDSGRGPTYFALSAAMNHTKHIPVDTTGLDFSNGVWISRVKCTPSMQWEVSSCVWNGSAMGNCNATPDANTTELDTKGLDDVNWYITGTLLGLYQEGHVVLALPSVGAGLMYNLNSTSDFQYRAPSMQDYDALYGLVAQSINSITTNGYYGTAIVPTEGHPAKPVYIVRTYILALAVIMLGLASALSILNLFYHHWNHLPWRKVSFLTIANAVRGPWWDQTLYGSCALDQDELRRRHQMKVMFGVDHANPYHINFAPEVQRIEKGATYYGVQGSA